MPVIISELAFLSFLLSLPLFSPLSEFRDDENLAKEGKHFAFLSLAVGENGNLSIKTILPADMYTLSFIFL